MSTQIITSTLQKSADLVKINQPDRALDLLVELLGNKRTRHFQVEHVMSIISQAIQLIVQLKKTKVAKDVLYLTRTIFQNTTIQSIEQIVNQFIKLSEELFESSLSSPSALSSSLDYSISPDQLVLASMGLFNPEQKLDKSAFQFLWEAYRTALDTTRNNPKLELIHHDITLQAFQFLKLHKRKVEFRRLSDQLRQNIQNCQKYANQSNSINLNDPDTLQRHLDARFLQLSVATDLELWQEAFKTIEDINLLITLSKKTPKTNTMKTYYEKLARVFLIGENWLFHAASLQSYYNLCSPQSEQDEAIITASCVVLSALAVPNSAVHGDDEKYTRLSSLLSTSPTRQSIVESTITQNALNQSLPEVKRLYGLIEGRHNPLTISSKVAPLLNYCSKNHKLAIYVQSLRQIVLQRILTLLSEVYHVMRMEEVMKFLSPLNMTAFEFEMHLMTHYLKIQVDHKRNTIKFTPERVPISTFCALLRNAIPQKQEREFVAQYMYHGKEQVQELLARKEVIELEKQRREESSIKVVEKDVVKKSKAELEEEKRIKGVEIIQKLEAKKLSDKIIQDMKAQGMKSAIDLSTLTVPELKAYQDKQDLAIKEIKNTKLKGVAKRNDYFVRALRIRECEVLKEKNVRMRFEEKEKREKKKVDAYIKACAAYERAIELKGRCEKMMDAYITFSSTILKEEEERENAKRLEKEEKERKVQKAKEAEREQREKKEEEKKMAFAQLEKERMIRDAERREAMKLASIPAEKSTTAQISGGVVESGVYRRAGTASVTQDKEKVVDVSGQFSKADGDWRRDVEQKRQILQTTSANSDGVYRRAGASTLIPPQTSSAPSDGTWTRASRTPSASASSPVPPLSGASSDGTWTRAKPSANESKTSGASGDGTWTRAKPPSANELKTSGASGDGTWLRASRPIVPGATSAPSDGLWNRAAKAQETKAAEKPKSAYVPPHARR